MSGFAIRVNKATKWYKVGEPVLKDLSMSVEQGTIYGLLGESGGGKTTLLRCIMGLRRLNSGQISVFGRNSSDCSLLKNIGYMPQDTALYELFKIPEIFEYFGILAGLSNDEIKNRTSQLVELLQLPNNSQLIKKLSGGEKRRVSLGISLIGGNSLKLLILDEPTVGNDPTIKQEIWKHLRDLVKEGMTILLTTHCTSEGGLCDRIGLLRKGRLIAEDNPANLMARYNVDLLEEAMLCICHENLAEDENFNTALVTTPENTANSKICVEVENPDKDSKVTKIKKYLTSSKQSLRKLKAITKRNLIFQLIRQPLVMLMTLITPVMQVGLVIYLMGRDPKAIKLNLFNQETVCVPDNSSQSPFLSCKLLGYLNSSTNHEIIWEESDSLNMAKNDVNFGLTTGYVHFPQNFTENFLLRLALRQFAQKEELEGSEMKIHLDNSSPVILIYLLDKMLDSVGWLFTEVAEEFGVDKKEIEWPLKFNSVYESGSDWQDFFAPPIAPLVTCLLSLGWAALSHSDDISTGTAERSRVGGAKNRHLYFSYFLSGTITTLLGSVIVYSALFIYFGVGQLKGELWLLFLFSWLGGWAGNGIGLLLATIFQNTMQVVLTALFVAFSFLFTCGMQFPMEAIPYAYRIFLEWFNPTIRLIVSARAVWSKGVGISHPIVLRGMTVPLFWIVTTSVACIVLRTRQNI